jgi:hypothetical protein
VFFPPLWQCVARIFLFAACRAHGRLAAQRTRAAMTNGLAVFLAVCIAGFLALDAALWDWQVSLFLARRFADLLNWLAFWR